MIIPTARPSTKTTTSTTKIVLTISLILTSCWRWQRGNSFRPRTSVVTLKHPCTFYQYHHMGSFHSTAAGTSAASSFISKMFPSLMQSSQSSTMVSAINTRRTSPRFEHNVSISNGDVAEEDNIETGTPATPSTKKRRRSPSSSPPSPRGSRKSTTKEQVAEDEQRTVVAVTPDTSKVKRKSKKVKIDSPEKNKVATRKKTTTTATTTATTTVTTTIQVLPPHVGTAKPPHGWEDIYTLVQELRSDRTAPCDFEGGEALPEPELIETDPKTHRFQILIALMLSSQTKDATVGQAMRNLQNHGLTVENLLQTSHEDLDRLIQKVGFHNNKTKYIKQVVQILRDEYDDDIPPTAAEMIEKLPGVGPKMAYIIENAAWGVCSGIGVDTHMHRIFNQLRWVNSRTGGNQTKTPEQTRMSLEAWLPHSYWSDVNLLWVGFGQESTQQKQKMLRKALECSRPREAVRLLKRLGMNVHQEAAKMDCKQSESDDGNIFISWSQRVDQLLKKSSS